MSLWIILGLLTTLYVTAVWFFFQGLAKLHQGNSKKTPSVSVIVAARNEAQHIRSCLGSLLQQNYAGEYDITVVDDQSTDDTAQAVWELAQHHPNLRLIQIQQPREGWSPKKYALNMAIEHSSGEIICATDADCTVPPDWIQGLVRQFLPQVGMVAGLVQINSPDRRGSLWVRLQALELFSLFMVAAGSMGNGLAFSASGGNLAYRRDTFRQAGGFQQIKHLISGDDDLLLQHMAAETTWEAKFCLDANTVVTTNPMFTLRAFLRQRRRWASKSPHQRRSLFSFLVITYLTNLVLLLALPVTLAMGGRWVAVPLICLAMKAVSELFLLCRGARIFGRMDLLKTFPLWELIHVPYVALIGVAGLFGAHVWRGRRFSGQKGTAAGGAS